MKKIISLLLATAMLVGVMAGCGTKSSVKDQTQKTEIGISFWEGGTEQEIEKGLTKVIEKYATVNPNVTVKLISQPSDGYTQWLNTRYASKGMPEIVMSQSNNLRDAYEQGLILDISADFNAPNNYAGGKVWKDTFVEGSLSNAHSDIYPPTYAIPMQGLGLAYYYNKDIYKKLNLKIPKTYNEFISNCDKIKADGINPVALPTMKKDAVSWLVWYYTTGLFANKYLVDDKFNPNHDKTVHNNEHVRAIEEGWFDITKGDNKADFVKYLSMVEEFSKYAEKSTGLDEAGAKAQFLSGKAAHLMSGSWDLQAFVLSDETSIDIGAFPLPEFTTENSPYAGAQLTIASYTPFGITKTAEKSEDVKKASIDFMKFLTAPSNYKDFVETAGCIPAVSELKIDNTFNAFTTGNQPLLPVFARGSANSVMDINNATIKVLSGEGYNADELAVAVQKSYVEYAKEFKEKLGISKDNNYKIDELPKMGEFVPLKPSK